MFQPTISPLALFCSKYSVRLVQIYGSEVGFNSTSYCEIDIAEEYIE